MAHLTVDIGGKPGVNCRGFCEYCYFKHVKEVPPLDAATVPPIGWDVITAAGACVNTTRDGKV